MKNFLLHQSADLLRLSILAGTIYLAECCFAQDNVWTSAMSGNWQDASWSLGLPMTNHTLWITNAGWKAVQIGSATAQNFPQSLSVNAINISSPANTFNTLLLNFAGSAKPLTVKSLTVASNSAVTMFSSALQINGPNDSGMTIGGRFEQNNSVVAGNQVNVGYVGPGIYNFNSGYFTVSQLWLGGSDHLPGTFIQNGGTNGFGITHLDGGTYVLSNGYYSATIYFDKWGEFHQRGGMLASDLTLFNGNYLLAGGTHQGSVMVPSPNGFSDGFSGMLQTGGTNLGGLDIGSGGSGIYTLSNGLCTASSMTVDFGGGYFQWDGMLQVDGVINLHEEETGPFFYSMGQFYLHGGKVSSGGMSLEGYYSQTGGTNFITGGITMQNIQSSINLSDGLLAANSLFEAAGWVGGVNMTGGTMVLTNGLNVEGIDLPGWNGFSCGGQLVVSNIRLGPRGIFSCRNGVVIQSGILTMDNATLNSGTNCARFGPLALEGGNFGGNTNSTFHMVSPTSVLTFADSGSQAWDADSLLIIEGWSGSLNGGSSQQIVFGNNSKGLTSAQLAHIQFHNPAGLTNGFYPARILASGEIVPIGGVAVLASIALLPQPEGMRVMLQGEAGRTYCIQTSVDLVHWASWTNQLNATGTMTVTDTDATNYSSRFYRAQLMP